jgi:hypothetical protein
MKNMSKKTKKRLSDRTIEPVSPATKPERTQPAEPLAGTEAPVTSTPDFKAGKDL